MSRTYFSGSAEDAPRAAPLSTVQRPTSVPPRSSSYHYALRERGSGNSLRASNQEGAGTKSVDSAARPTTPRLARKASVLRGREYAGPPAQDGFLPDECPFPARHSTSRTPRSLAKYRQKPHVRMNYQFSAYPSPPSSPDRFIPSRQSSGRLAKAFQANKAPDQLSPSERVLRNQSASQDPFRRRQVSPTTILNGNNTNQPSQFTPDTTSPRVLATGSTTRVLSVGAVWNVGGVAPVAASPIASISDGRGGLLGSGTNAPIFGSSFFEPETTDQSLERFEGRLAAALGIDQTSKILNFAMMHEVISSPTWTSSISKAREISSTVWKDGAWVDQRDFRVLDAPMLRDDFYCSILAYCPTSGTLAVGLHSRVYLWSESDGVSFPPLQEESSRQSYVTSLSFSSAAGGDSILAIGRSDGLVNLWSLFDESDKFQCQQPNGISCLAFKPVLTHRTSDSSNDLAPMEDLLVGDDMGKMYYYSIEWDIGDSDDESLGGSMNLLVKIDIHTQQICGIAWSPDGEYFATGSNDNACLLFNSRDVVAPPVAPLAKAALSTPITGLIPNFVPNARSHFTLSSMIGSSVIDDSVHLVQEGLVPYRNSSSNAGHAIRTLGPGHERHRWQHSAAVKAIAFCPWQRGLLATGGGSNDRAIHFYHAWSGACLATINVHAQVTSLIWSKTRREIAATFGYAQPEHPYRIAVFSWPGCKQVVSIPWNGEIRALYAIPYPGGPNQSRNHQSAEGERWWKRTAAEGCIVVAGSDESVKFHEVWSEEGHSVGDGVGGLGWSDILEGLEGIEKEGSEVIR